MTRKKPPTALWVLAGLLAIYLVAPFVAGAGQAGLADWRSTDLAGLTKACLISVASASCATGLIALGGAPLGYLLDRTPGRAMAVLGFMVQLPLALPPLASGVLLLFLLGYSSPLGQLTNGALTDSFAGIVLAETFVAAPFLIIAARSAFAAVDPGLEDVAATLGHKPWSIFLRVSLPLARRTILAGMLLAWLRAFGEFGATVMVAYHPYSLPVFTYVAFGGQGLPAMMPILAPTALVAIVVMLASQALGGRRREAKAPAFTSDAELAADPVEARTTIFGRDAAKGVALDFAIVRRLGDFELRATWRTDAKRLAILGPSGSGKSMTLRALAGLDRSHVHRLAIGGRDVASLPPHARRVAYVPQNYGLFPNMPVDEQIRFSTDVDVKASRFWMERLGLRELERRRPSELSLGQQQRVALARALSRRAEIILLDEPLSALDAPLRAHLRRELLALQREIEATTILVTHDPAEALLLADDLLILDAGRVLQTGPVETVFLRPANETVARLLGAENVNHGYAVDVRTIDVGDGALVQVSAPPLTPGRRIGWACKSYRIRPSPTGRYGARILQIGEPRAGERTFTLRLGDAVLQMSADPAYAQSDGCRVDIDPQAVQVWEV